MTTAESVRRPAARLAVLGLLLCGTAIAFRVMARPAVVAADARFADRVMAWRNWQSRDAQAHGTIVHVDLDDRSARMFTSGDAGRDEFAAVMRTIAAVGAAAQVYDFVFEGASAVGDQALAAAAQSSPHVYVGSALGFAGRTLRNTAADTDAAAHAARWTIPPPGARGLVPTATSALWPFGDLARSVAGIGFLNVEPDPDGVFRRVPLVAHYRGTYHPSLALRAVSGYLHVRTEHVVLEPGRAVTLRGARFPDGRRDLVIPVDASGAMRLDFRRAWSGFHHYSMGDLWRDSMDPTAVASWRAALDGRVVIVAEVATTRGDIGPAPIDSRLPLAALHSTAIANILEGRFLRSAPAWAEAATAAFALALLWVTATVTPRALWASGLAVVVMLLGGAAALQLARGVLVPVTVATALSIAFVIVAGTWRFVDAAREREITRRAFESYFPPPVVARLIAARGRLSNGVRKELTVVFSDIVGFTSRSATMAPEDVQAFLNAYFTTMVDVVFEHGGTVDKFIGDGLMVFFNDPDEQPDHAERAVRCALAMQAKAGALAGGVTVRIGVHTGPAIVGNMGAARRLSYTAIGSNVNLAQRLESAAPQGGVLISDDTARRLPPDIAVRDAGLIHVKGFESAVHVFVATAPGEAVAV